MASLTLNSARLLLVVFAIILVGNRFSRHAIFLANPLAQIEQLAAFRTKRAKGITLPFDLSIAGWTMFH